jgi:hypothetical protein
MKNIEPIRITQDTRIDSHQAGFVSKRLGRIRVSAGSERTMSQGYKISEKDRYKDQNGSSYDCTNFQKM